MGLIERELLSPIWVVGVGIFSKVALLVQVLYAGIVFWHIVFRILGHNLLICSSNKLRGFLLEQLRRMKFTRGHLIHLWDKLLRDLNWWLVVVAWFPQLCTYTEIVLLALNGVLILALDLRPFPTFLFAFQIRQLWREYVLIDLYLMQGLLLEPLLMLMGRAVLWPAMGWHESFLYEKLYLFIFHFVRPQGNVYEVIQICILDHFNYCPGVYLLRKVMAFATDVLDCLKEWVP